MTEMGSGKGSIAARLGGWSVRHRKTAILGWLLFVVVAVAGAVRILDQAGIRPGAGGDGVGAQRHRDGRRG